MIPGKFSVLTATAPAAMHGALAAAGIAKGDEVIVSPLNHPAVVNAILHQGATHVFADVDYTSLCLDPAAVENRITDKTTAIIASHYAGHPCDMEALQDIARRNQLMIIEDATMAWGAQYQGQPVGSTGDLTVFGFNWPQSVYTGQGGMITTNSEELYQWLKIFCNGGIVTAREELLNQEEGPWYYEMLDIGFGYQMSELVQGELTGQLAQAQEQLDRRRAIAAQYSQDLADLTEIYLPQPLPQTQSAWYFYPICLRLDLLAGSRREIGQALLAAGVPVAVHFLPVYQHPYYKWVGHKDLCSIEGPLCPTAEYVYERELSLPTDPTLTDGQVEQMIAVLKATLKQYRKAEK